MEKKIRDEKSTMAEQENLWSKGIHSPEISIASISGLAEGSALRNEANLQQEALKNS